MPNPPAQSAPDDDGVKLTKFAGLKNVVASERLGPDELELAINVDLDDVGQLSRRQGQTLLLAGATTSLYQSQAGKIFCVREGVLGQFLPNATFNAIETGYDNAVLCYAQVGDDIYFSGGSSGVSGILSESQLTVSSWGPANDFWLSPVVNPTSTLPSIRGRLLGKPPAATVLCYFNGRIYLAQNNLVWYTELYSYSLVDRTKNFYQFEAPVTMLGAVTDGIYVGTTEGVWFLAPTGQGMKRTRVLDSGVIPGTMAMIPGELANPSQVGLDEETPVKVSIAFMTKTGYCGGQDGGNCYNYTEEKFIFPAMLYGAGLFRRQSGINQYVVSANSAGDPVQDARIGDYVDATIRRAGTWREVKECLKISDTFSATVI